MELSHIVLVCLLAFTSSHVSSWRIFHKGRPKHGLLGTPVLRSHVQKLPPDEWFEQKLDHFNPQQTFTWRQKYFTNATFYKPGGPVFLMIGGEGAANATWMVEGSWLDYAAQSEALCFQLEHRFYGDSHPTKDMSVKNLAYLSSEQALADLANFILGMASKHDLPSATKWIAFGGSYPGSLAAWLRLKYPHLVHAAVSTSGPLLALADFKDYFNVVEASLSTAGESCVKAVGNATQQIDTLLKHMVGLNTLKTLFRLCDDIDPNDRNDVANLYDTLAGSFAEVVQYNKDNRAFEGAKTANITIDVVCGVMANSSIGPAVHRYAQVSNMLLDANGEKCLDFSYRNLLKSLRNVTWGKEGARQWTYQTCTEFGFFQTSNQKSHIFGNKFPLDFYIQQCSDIFGRRFNADLLTTGIERTNMMYGALSVDASNVVFVHGSIDPWHALGITKNISLTAPAIFIQGCSFPGAPAHSSVYFSDERLVAGTVATYACERGFELLGPSRRVCGEDGRWTPEGIPFCVLNVAAGKAPMQISTDQGGVPQKAIDGSTSSFYNGDTCTVTKPERVPWWYVNLLEPYMVQLVRLDFGNSQEATIVVRVGNNRPDLGTNPICNRFSGLLEEGKPLFLPCNPPMPGAFVSVHLEDAAPSRLSICEAFVYTDQALPIERCPQFRDQPPGSTATYNGKCYIFYNRQPLTFKDALAFCKSRGGTLVDESNPALQGFISWELWRRHRSDTTSQYWMGAVRDPQDRNNWKWIDGQDVSVSFWNLPGGNENCARFDGSKGWLWSDTNCNTNLNFICQHQPKACGRPEQPPNSTMIAKNFNVGSAIEYNCDEGHLLVGPALRTCLPTGFYNEFPPVCKRIECGFPAEIANGFYQLINGTVGYLSQVIYSCEEGYEMLGRAQLMCDIDERWNGPPPRCQPIECEEPPSIGNGKYVIKNNATTVGTVVEYSCSSPTHKLVGPKTIVCLPSGFYDKKPPVCKDEAKAGGAGIVAVPSKPGVSRNPLKPSTPAPVTRPALRPHKEPEDRRTDSAAEETARIPSLAAPSPPQENEIPDSVNRRADLSHNAVVGSPIEEERREAVGARLNLGAIIALGVFGGFVFLAAIITTIVILIRRNRSAKHYRHRASPDCNTVASFDSSGSESRGGLNRYYRQAWENLHQTAGAKAPLQRKETLDEPPKRYHNLPPPARAEGMRDGGELVVADVVPPKPSAIAAAEKKRHHHHHHHHHHGGSGEWRQPHARPQHKNRY